jgi:hypothetical protein
MSERPTQPPKLVNSSDEHAATAPLPASVSLGRSGQARSASSPHAHKFRIALALLVGLGIAAVVVALAIAISGVSGPGPAWSTWKPTDSGIQGAVDIADYLAPVYRISGTDQLDVVTVVNLSNANSVNPLTGAPEGLQVSIRPNATSSAATILPGNTVAYNLCGVGSSNCAITQGQPSTLRQLLLRREALELALYTLKYVSGTSNVIAILPPGYAIRQCTGLCPTPHPKQTKVPQTTAVLFTHNELTPWLNQPLRATLPNLLPPTVPELSLWKGTGEAALVDQLTGQGLFAGELVHAQDGSTMIELTPQPPS